MSDRARGRWVVLVTVSVLVAACSDSTTTSYFSEYSAPATQLALSH